MLGDGFIIEGKVLRWGNSYGIRIAKKELQAAGLKPGMKIRLRLEGPAGEIDVDSLFAFFSDEPDVSERHDEILGEARWRELHGKEEQ